MNGSADHQEDRGTSSHAATSLPMAISSGAQPGGLQGGERAGVAVAVDGRGGERRGDHQAHAEHEEGDEGEGQRARREVLGAVVRLCARSRSAWRRITSEVMPPISDEPGRPAPRSSAANGCAA